MIVCLGDVIVDVLVRRVGLPSVHSAVEHIAIAPGGAAANTAAWLADQCTPTGFIGALGTDFAGDMLMTDLERRGIVCAISRVPDRPSGILLLEWSSGGALRATARRGANDSFVLDDEQRALLMRATWLHITAYALFAETSHEPVLEAARLAHSVGARVSLDLGAAHLVSHVGAREYLRLLRALEADVLLANEAEASLLSEHLADPLDALGALAGIAVLKRGAAGSSVLAAGRRFDVAAVSAEEVDPTGAGDAFAAGLILALSRGVSLTDAAYAGCVLGARCAATLGGRPPLAPAR